MLWRNFRDNDLKIMYSASNLVLHFSIQLECTHRLVICYPDISSMVQLKAMQHSNPLKTPSLRICHRS